MDDPTLFIHWLFSWLALVIMVARLVWRKVARQPFNGGDYLTMGACFCVMARMGLIHVVLTWKTNNVSAAIRKTYVFTAEDIHRRQVGSKLSLVNRVFYNSYLWLQKLVLLDVYRRLFANLPYEKITIYSFFAIFFATYVTCQLIIVGVLNIVTDFMLLVLPIPLVVSMKAAWKLKMQLYALFLLGVFIIAITIIRLPINANNKDSQVNRSTWASTELLAAAFVVNAPTLYGLWNKKRQAKSSSNSHGTGGLSNYGMGTTVSTARKTKVDDDENDEYMMSPVRRNKGPVDGILQTKEIIVSEFRETDRRGRGYANLPDEHDDVSTSSRKSILRA
ncbi:hypothetical protein ACHAQA_009681 [Verticillium albo-atrum]